MLQIGIDFGTTHTTAAFFDGQQIDFVPLDEANKDSHLLRSLIYITRSHESILGVEAAQTYLRDNTGRLVRIVEKKVGTIENTVARVGRGPLEPDGPIVIVYDVHIEEDVGAPGRLVQSIKTGLRDADYMGTAIFDRFFTVEELIALLLARVREKAATYLGKPVTGAVIGRPVTLAATPEADALAEARLRRAAEMAGLGSATFVLEPVAAALFYILRQPEPQTVLVFDFGGGTLDLTVIYTDGSQQPPHILATQGVTVGGDDFDTALMRRHVAPYFGAGSVIDRDGHPLPAHLIGKLDHWQTIPELSRTEHLPTIRRARLFGNNPAAFAALETLALKNYGFAVFGKIEQAKRALSSSPQTMLEMEAEAIHLSLEITRKEFQVAIMDEIAAVQQGIDAVLRQSDVTANDVDVVVTTGGSSLIPIFQQILRRRFATARVVHSDTFGSVAAGLAIHTLTI
ncbi:MAG TPA: Hsp70 family protein [Anaerolineae bacterium]